MNQSIVMHEQQQDQFERLPDELLLHILNKVDDARSLAQCFSVSTRLGSLIPEVHSVSLTIAPPAPNPGRKTSRNRFLSAVVKPVIRLLSRLVLPKSSRGEEDECTCRCPHEILKGFRGIQSLRIELPFCENEIENLKWIADFGTELNSCVVVGWNSLERRGGLVQSEDKIKESAAVDPILTDKELKRRVVWIISTLIAASSRQLMLKELVEDHIRLEDIVITDANKQGRLVAGKEGIDVIRKSLPESDPANDNAVVPDLKMKLWHVPELELPESGFVMSGATLVVIKPDELIVHILNKVDDARSLVLCISVSKHLASLVPLADRIFLSVAPPAPEPVRKTNHGRFLCRLMSPNLDECRCSFRCPHEILQGFSEIRSLQIELPFCERKEFQMLKWFADFGTELNGCAIVGAKSLQRKVDCSIPIQLEDKVEEFAVIDSILPEKELELRELWIIYVLIAASSRHLALRELLDDHLKLEEIVMTDVNKQGKLCVRKEEMNAIRKSLESDSEESEAMAVKSMLVPDLKIRLWHVSELELPESGYVMGGATLIMIRSAKANDITEGSCGDFCGWFGQGEVFDGDGESDDEGKAFGEAFQKMKNMNKSKSYSMDIKSFQV